MNGTTLKRINTLNTMYANNKIELTDKKGNIFRIDVSEILPLLKREKFTVEMKRKYNHLIIKT